MSSPDVGDAELKTPQEAMGIAELVWLREEAYIVIGRAQSNLDTIDVLLAKKLSSLNLFTAPSQRARSGSEDPR